MMTSAGAQHTDILSLHLEQDDLLPGIQSVPHIPLCISYLSLLRDRLMVLLRFLPLLRNLSGLLATELSGEWENYIK